MSWPAVHWAFAQRAPSSAAKFLLIVLADNAAVDDWRTWPSIPYLVETTQQDRKTVLKNLRALESAALISPVGKTGRTGQVTVWRLPVITASVRPKRAKNGTLADSEAGPDFPAKSPRFPGKESQKRDTEPVKEPGREPKMRPSDAVASDSSPDRQQPNRPQAIACPYEAIFDAYEELLPDLPRIRLRDDEKRRTAMRKRWVWVLSSTKGDGSRRATTTDEALAWFREFFRRASLNDWLMGRKPSPNYPDFKANLDFLLRDTGWRAVIERTEVPA